MEREQGIDIRPQTRNPNDEIRYLIIFTYLRVQCNAMQTLNGRAHLIFQSD